MSCRADTLPSQWPLRRGAPVAHGLQTRDLRASSSHHTMNTPRQSDIASSSSSSGSKTDLELLQAWRQGDALAATELVARYDSALRRYHRQRLGPDLYEDEVQRTWLAVLRGFERFQGRSTVRTYLYGIAFNCVRETRRREQRGRMRTAATASLPDARPDLDVELAHDQQRRRLAVAIERLPAPRRRLIELYYGEQRPAREIGALLGLVENTVRSRIRSAVQEVRQTVSASPQDRRDGSAPRADTTDADGAGA